MMRHWTAAVWISAAAVTLAVLTGCASTTAGTAQRGGNSGTELSDSTAPAALTNSTSASNNTPTSGSSPGGNRPVPPTSGTGATTGASTQHPTVIPSVPAAPGPVSPARPSISNTPTPVVAPSPPPAVTPSTSTVTVTAATSGGTATPNQALNGSTPVDPAKFPGLVTPVGFSSPSGNINCGFTATASPSVVCQIAHRTYKAPSGDCGPAGEWGSTIALTSSGPQFLCAGDVEGGGPALAYGSRIEIGPIACVSRQDGITCLNTGSGSGFRVATASYLFF